MMEAVGMGRFYRYLAQHPKLPQKAKDFVASDVGPFTVMFWAPTWKVCDPWAGSVAFPCAHYSCTRWSVARYQWGLVAAGLADLQRPVDKISRPQSTGSAE